MSARQPVDNYSRAINLAGQIEMEWSDRLLRSFIEEAVPLAGRIGAGKYLVEPSYYVQAAEWVAAQADLGEAASMADVGAGLGRFLYELLRRAPGIRQAAYVEPSPTLFRWGERLLSAGREIPYIPYVEGLGRVEQHEGSRDLGLEAQLLDKISLINGSADTLSANQQRYDLVSSLNVVDQCAYPSVFASEAMELVKSGGYAVFASTYQWQERFYIEAETTFANLNDLFTDGDWSLVAEADFDYEFRRGDRHRSRFLSHHVMYRRS